MSEIIPFEDPISARVYHYKRAGESFRDIADRLELSSAEVVRRYREYMREIVAEYSITERDHIVAMELQRLDELMIPFLASGVTGDKEGAETTLKIMSQRMKLLRLDQPTPDELTRNAQVIVVTGSKEEFEQALREGREQRQVTGPSGDDEGDKEAR